MHEFESRKQLSILKKNQLKWKFLGWSFVACLCILIAWYIGPRLWNLIQDRSLLEAFVVQLGWFGPIMLVGLNILQIIVSPIPGYAVQAASGVLYGGFWGGIWANLGMMIGAMLAMYLARTFGRPLAERLVSSARLDKWEKLTTNAGTLLWFILIFGPTGDIPYYLAGLAKVSYTKIALLILTVRVPTTFAITAASAGTLNLTWWQVTLIIFFLSGLFMLFIRYQDALQQWLDDKMQEQLR